MGSPTKHVIFGGDVQRFLPRGQCEDWSAVACQKGELLRVHMPTCAAWLAATGVVGGLGNARARSLARSPGPGGRRPPARHWPLGMIDAECRLPGPSRPAWAFD